MELDYKIRISLSLAFVMVYFSLQSSKRQNRLPKAKADKKLLIPLNFGSNVRLFSG